MAKAPPKVKHPFIIMHISPEDFIIWQAPDGDYKELGQQDATVQRVMSAQETIAEAQQLDTMGNELLAGEAHAGSGGPFRASSSYGREYLREQADIHLKNLSMAEIIFKNNLEFVQKLKGELELQRAKLALAGG